ncbi:MAG: protein translocase subunit SecF [Pseudomonadota bacterium]
MQFIKPNINIDFIGKRKFGYALSTAFVLLTFLLLIYQGGPRYGIDFSGGTLIQVKFENQVPLDQIAKGLGNINLDSSATQQFGDKNENEYLIRTDQFKTNANEFTQQIQTALTSENSGKVEIRRVEAVGAQVGKDLREKASYAFFYALLFITIYISGRFEMKWVLSAVMAFALIGSVYFLSLFDVSIPILIAVALIVTIILFWFLKLKYAMGAIVALIHDAIVTVGFFAVFDKEFTLSIVAALLTIVGYSLNDTIVVFDRVRENLKKQQKYSLDILVNRSINETLARTLLTSGATLIVLFALFFFGGAIIHDFAFTMIVGIFVGTYSSIFVASPLLLAWREK